MVCGFRPSLPRGVVCGVRTENGSRIAYASHASRPSRPSHAGKPTASELITTPTVGILRLDAPSVWSSNVAAAHLAAPPRASERLPPHTTQHEAAVDLTRFNVEHTNDLSTDLNTDLSTAVTYCEPQRPRNGRQQCLAL